MLRLEYIDCRVGCQADRDQIQLASSIFHPHLLDGIAHFMKLLQEHDDLHSNVEMRLRSGECVFLAVVARGPVGMEGIDGIHQIVLLVAILDVELGVPVPRRGRSRLACTRIDRRAPDLR